MNDLHPDLAPIGLFILKRAHDESLALPWPASIEYGYGWTQTITFWVNNRRVHFYYDIVEGYPVIEIADRNLRRVMRVRRPEEADCWTLLRDFLFNNLAFESLPDLGWIEDNRDHDKFIPHPPDIPSSANIADVIKLMEAKGERYKPE